MVNKKQLKKLFDEKINKRLGVENLRQTPSQA